MFFFLDNSQLGRQKLNGSQKNWGKIILKSEELDVLFGGLEASLELETSSWQC
jgi:hypothetical protein